MTPTLPDILLGQALTLSTPLPPEAAGDYAAGRMGMLAMLAMLAAQEAERGGAARLWENGAIAALLARIGAPAPPPPDDQSWSALDVVNAALRRALIAVHEQAEVRGDTALEREILELYGQMAHRRRLDMPGAG